MIEMFARRDRERNQIDDLTQPTSFGPSPVPMDRNGEQTRIQAVLLTYLTPQLKYHGVSAYEIAGKILAVLDRPAESRQ